MTLRLNMTFVEDRVEEAINKFNGELHLFDEKFLKLIHKYKEVKKSSTELEGQLYNLISLLKDRENELGKLIEELKGDSDG